MLSAFYEMLVIVPYHLGNAIPRTHVEVDDLCQQRADHKHEQHICEPLVELRLAIDLSENGTSQALSSNDAQSSD